MVQSEVKSCLEVLSCIFEIELKNVLSESPFSLEKTAENSSFCSLGMSSVSGSYAAVKITQERMKFLS
ncbi:Uncharacterised protein [Porphyromonas crevioricanis]|uniref:Uncharacterized protein n=1 Tax=Porphyromonas crevioricanis TaxID=393921 RepID=A0A2X4PPW6_9PORP|nr:hypothetical protein PORCAN_839 [Porphyromonas crevioricanis JCM 13913]SQH73983.1 Uncharacterised protein [Porphyromonas crevioricanis]